MYPVEPFILHNVFDKTLLIYN